MSNHLLSDNELVERYRYSHDNEYVGELYNRYSHLVLGLCIKYFKDVEIAKDAVMDIFEILIYELKRHHIDNFKSWLYIVAKNHCLQTIRKTSSNRNKKDLYSIFLDETMESTTDLHPNSEKEKLLTRLEEIIPELKNNQRMCIKMFYLEQKTYAEIAKELNFSLKEVKSYIQNGKRNLKNKLTS